MSEKVFFSFHYKQDSHRVQRIKQIGALEGQPLLDFERLGESEARR
jgi:hypothetical protein